VSIYRGLARHVLAPGMDLVRGTQTMRNFSALETSQWWPRERLEHLQSERLQRLIRHAHEQVPYYGRLMRAEGVTPADIASVNDLMHLPVLTKRVIRQHSTELIACGFPKKGLRPMTTSGSTGEPLVFYSTAEDQFSRGIARTLRALQWAGLDIGDRHVVLARPRRYARAHEQLLHNASLRVKRVMEIDTSDLSDAHLRGIVARIGKLGRVGLMSSPPVLALLATWLRRTGTDIPSLRCIVSGGEQLLDHERESLTEVFGLQPFSKYGAFEAYDIASECAAHAGLHIQTEDIIVEIVDDDGRPVPPGCTGHILITNLHNYAMPFIRYAIGDVGAIATAKCDCGRELPRLVGMLGRMSELIVTPSGRRVFGADLGLESLGPLGVREFKIVQHDIAETSAFLVWHDDIPAESRAEGEARIRGTLEQAIGEGVRVRVQSVEHIEPTRAGKYCVVVSEVAPRSIEDDGPRLR
jgi:phenylacetate-CoA ligase